MFAGTPLDVSRETVCRRVGLMSSLLDVSRETQARLGEFTNLLLRWNRRINLISPGDEAAVASRHIEDSLQLAAYLPAGVERGVDLGSGAGFPGLILAIATDMKFDLIEADHRKCAFLREASRAAAASTTVHAMRIEDCHLPPADVITARALAPLPRLLGLAHPLLSQGGVGLFPKGRGIEAELAKARTSWCMELESHPSRIDPNGVILRVSNLRRA